MTIRCETEHPIENKFQFSNLYSSISKFTDFLLLGLANYMDNKAKIRNRKNALKELSNLSNSTLLDIGISRADADWAYSQSTLGQTSKELETFLKTKKACR